MTTRFCIRRLLAAMAVMLLGGSSVWGARYTYFAPLTLSGKLEQADAAVLVQWIAAHKGKPQQPGSTDYAILEVLRGPDSLNLKTGGLIRLARFRDRKPGDLALLFREKGPTGVIDWDSPLEVTTDAFNYLAQAPGSKAKASERARYFMKFLEFPDVLVATDAHTELSAVSYADLRELAKDMPLEKLRAWVANPETPSTRLGLYGVMLGMCGNQSDGELLARLIRAQTGDIRLGIDGVMCGYLLLTGEHGLELIEKNFKNKSAPFGETYAGMLAVRFMWVEGNGAIKPERLRESMRLLLDRPELADLVISDLARWTDWTMVDRVISLYNHPEYAASPVKRAIVRYLLALERDLGTPRKTLAASDSPKKENKPSTKPAQPPNSAAATASEHVAKARRFLDELLRTDPETVAQVERLLMAKPGCP